VKIKYSGPEISRLFLKISVLFRNFYPFYENAAVVPFIYQEIIFCPVNFLLYGELRREFSGKSSPWFFWIKEAGHMNITLIGMAGAGKSTIGKALAKRLNYTFIDVDGMITKKTGMPLQALIDKQGDSALIRFEEEAILELEQVDNCIISPGGSVVYSEKAMEHLKKISKIVFLDAPFRSIVRRIPNARKRGIVGLRDRSLKELFEERLVLYRKYADFSIRLKGRENVQGIAGRIIQLCFEPEP